MGFPTTGILDDAQRADENPLSFDGRWGDRIAADDLQLLSNQFAGTVGGTTLNSRYWTPTLFGPDAEAYITVPTVGNSGDYTRLWLRIQNPGAGGETGYMMQWAPTDANGVRIFRETARETYTMLAQDTGQHFANNDTLGFEAIGTSLTVYKNGVAVLNTTDGTILAPGNIALGCRNTLPRLVNFGGGTVVVANQVLAMQSHIMGHNFW